MTYQPPSAGSAVGGPTPPHPSSTSDATRLLCGAVYTDATFRTRVLDELLYHPHRAVAPAYSIDVVPILQHGLFALRRVLIRDGILTVLLVLLLFTWTELALPIIALFLVFVVFSTFSGRRSAGASGTPRMVLLIVAVLIGAYLLYNFFSQAIQRALYSGSSGLTGGYSYDPYEYAAPSGLDIWWLLPFLVVTGLIATLYWHRWVTHSAVVSTLQPDDFVQTAAPEAPAWALKRLGYLNQAQRGNVTMYSERAGRHPLVGSGLLVSAWNISLPLVEAGKTAAGSFFGPAMTGQPEAVRLTSSDVYEATRAAIAGLSSPSLPDHERLHGLSIQDRLYVAGRLRTGSPYLDPNTMSPVFRVGPEAIGRVSLEERGPVRHYQVIRVSSWSGEVETTLFLYTAVNGDMLFVEFVATYMPAIRQAYHEIDGWERLTAEQATVLFGSALADLIRVAPGAPFRLIGHALRAIRRAASAGSAAEAIRSRLSFDYGCQMSVRGLGAADNDVLFHELDSNAVQSIVQRRVLGAIAATLAEHGYDLQEFTSQATNVFQNHGTLINNSTMVGSAVASGPGSKATTTTSAPGKS